MKQGLGLSGRVHVRILLLLKYTNGRGEYGFIRIGFE